MQDGFSNVFSNNFKCEITSISLSVNAALYEKTATNTGSGELDCYQNSSQ